MRRFLRHPPRALIAAIALIATASLAAAPAQAQESLPAVGLTVIRQPIWHGADDRLGVTVRITNPGPGDVTAFRLSLAAYDRVSTRSELASLPEIDPALRLPPSSYSRDFARVIGAGESISVTIDDPIVTLDTFARATDSGVYPLALSLLDELGNRRGLVITPLIYYPEDVETRLNLVPVLPLNDVSARVPNGTFPAAGDGTVNHLAAALAPGGWIADTLDQLELRTARRLRLGLAPTPRLLDELADMSDGYRTGETTLGPSSAQSRAARDALARIEGLLTSGPVQPVLVPYSFADLIAVADVGFEVLAEELSLGVKTIRDTLGIELDRRWILPPGGRIDTGTLGDLKDIDPNIGDRLLLSVASFAGQGDPAVETCPTPSPTFACTVLVRTAQGSSIAFRSDVTLQDHLASLADPGGDRIDLQRFFAETAMIREELPGIGSRIIQFTFPAGFHPVGRMAKLFYKGLATAPWLETVTPAEGVEVAGEPVVRDLAEPPRPAPNTPDEGYFTAVTEAREVVERLALIGPPVELVDRLRRDVLVGYSRNWWSEPELQQEGLDFAQQAGRLALGHIEAIGVLGAREITMTSRRGEIQLLLANDNDFPVTVAIRLSSPHLELADEGVVLREFPPNKATPITMSATAQASGIFPVEVWVETPGAEAVIFGPTSISIRSTELNRVAVSLTLGALAFLVLFYVFRSLRADPGPAPE